MASDTPPGVPTRRKLLRTGTSRVPPNEATRIEDEPSQETDDLTRWPPIPIEGEEDSGRDVMADVRARTDIPLDDQSEEPQDEDAHRRFKTWYLKKVEKPVLLLCITRFWIMYWLDWRYRKRFKAAVADVWSMRKVQKIYGVVNTKGGSGKTEIAALLSVILCKITERPVAGFDVNDSPGGYARRLGLNEKNTVMAGRFIRLCLAGLLDSYETFSSLVDWHKETGVSVIASERGKKERSKEPTRWAIRLALHFAKKNNHNVVCDFGNGYDTPGNLATIEMGHTLFGVANVRMKDSRRDLQEARVNYAHDGYEGKMREMIIFVLGDRNTAKNRAHYVKFYNTTPDRLVIIPANWEMTRTKEVSIRRLKLKTFTLLLEGLAAGMRAETIKEEMADISNDLPRAEVWRKKYPGAIDLLKAELPLQDSSTVPTTSQTPSND